jgi:hypothetical protein
LADLKFCDKCGVKIDAKEKFCPHCGSQNVSYDYKDEPLRIEHHKNIPWFKSKNATIFGIVGVIAIIIITVVAIQNTPLRNDGTLVGIFSEPVGSVLPTRDNGIETEWKRESVEYDYNLFVLSEFRPEGFVEAAQVYFHKNEFFVEDSSVRITVYKFDSVERASAEYATLIAKIRETGGFTERQISDIDATCYSTLNSNLDLLGSTYDINSYCTISNIVYDLAGNTLYADGIDKFAKVIAQRVEDKVYS